MRDAVVLGCGRSGTSLLAGVLAASGYVLGDRLLPANASNPRGFYEDREVNAINEVLLAPHTRAVPLDAVGRPLQDRPLREGERWLAVPRWGAAVRPDAQLRGRIRAAWRSLPEGRRALKDPRLVHTLPAWREHVDGAVRICVFREPARTARSILAHIGADPGALRLSWAGALAVWTQAYASLEGQRGDGDWVVVHYDQVVDGSALPRLAEALGAPLDASSTDRALGRSTAQGDVPRAAAELYARLCDAAGLC